MLIQDLFMFNDWQNIFFILIWQTNQQIDIVIKDLKKGFCQIWIMQFIAVPKPIWDLGSN